MNHKSCEKESNITPALAITVEMCENLSTLPNRLQRFPDSRPPPRRPTREIIMQVSTISADTAAQAAIVNRFAGSLRAWTFLVHQGYDYRQVFEFLVDMDGPERAKLPSSRDTCLSADIEGDSPD